MITSTTNLKDKFSYMSFPGIIKRITLTEAICQEWELDTKTYTDHYRCRRKEFSIPRFFHRYVLDIELGYGPTRTGMYFGVSHSTIIMSRPAHNNMMDTNKEYRAKVENVMKALESGLILTPEDIDLNSDTAA